MTMGKALHRLACQIAAQLPESVEEADLVLQIAARIIRVPDAPAAKAEPPKLQVVPRPH